MSGVSFPVNRPAGRALIVGTASSRSQPLGVLQRLGFTCAETDDPYYAMLELSRRPMVYRALILSLTGLYKEELQLIAAAKRRFPHVEVWLTHLEGRQAALAEAMRLGADGLLADDGLHRTAAGAFPVETIPGSSTRAPLREPITLPPAAAAPEPQPPRESAPDSTDDANIAEPVLSADELRALLQEQPALPHSGDE
ncbi:MAG TPA: hypothetical protein VGR35_15695 [Tepidisphaeraceae bacterium]|nr:hypothetical protein [Tepidisphaeraceae bacterium]